MAPRNRNLSAQEGERIHSFQLNSGSMSPFRRSKNSKRSTESIYDMLQMVSQVCVCLCRSGVSVAVPRLFEVVSDQQHHR